MKKTTLILACISFCSYSTIAQDHSYGVGLRVGAFNQRNTFNDKMQLTDENQNISSGFYFQAFANKELGKKKKWMIEANLGYNSYSYESMIDYPSMQIEPLYRYSFAKTNDYSLQINVRYAFLNLPKLNWKHYAGISIACHDNVTNSHSFYNTHTLDPNVVENDQYSYKIFHNYIGVEYFGKISLNKRLSVQYLAGYNFSTQDLTPSGTYVYDDPTIYRFNINFGIGYQL